MQGGHLMKGVKPKLRAVKGGLADVPLPPASLPPEMAEEWTVIAADLTKRGLLAASMVGALEAYCVALWTVRQAQAAIAEHGVVVKGAHGAPKPNPATGVLNRAMEQVARLAGEMGITVAARSRKGLQPHERESDADQAPTGLDL